MGVGLPFKKIFDVPSIPKPQTIVEPKPPLIRPEIKPPVVYDVPIPRVIHGGTRDVTITRNGKVTTQTITEPDVKETVTRIMHPSQGDVIQVKDIGTGAIDLFPVKGGLPAILDPKSKRGYSATGDVIYNVYEGANITTGGFRLPDWMQYTPFGQAWMFAEGYGEGGLWGGFENIGRTMTTNGNGNGDTDWKSIAVFGVIAIGGIWLLGKILGGRR